MKMYELSPVNGRKSFYGKAKVLIESDGSETLFSYDTPIVKRLANGDLIRLWDGWSNTTGAHIKAFCRLNKTAFMKL